MKKCPFKNLRTPFCKSSAKNQGKSPQQGKHPHLSAIAKHLKGFKK